MFLPISLRKFASNFMERRLYTSLLTGLFAVLLLCCVQSTQAATKTWTSTTVGGVWTTTGNWTGGTPVAGDDVVINPASATFTITGVPSISLNSITIGGSGTSVVTLQAATAGNTLTISGTSGFVLNNSLTLSSTTALNLTVSNTTATSSIASGKTLTVGAGCTLNFASGGTFTNSAGATGLVTTGSGIINFSGTSQTLPALTVATGGTLILSGSGTKTLNISMSIAGTLSMQGTATAGGIAPSYSAGATIEYKGSAAQTASSNEWSLATTNINLTVNNASGLTLPASRTVVNLTLTAGALSIGTTTLTVNGNATRSTGTLTSSATGTVIYNQGSAGQTVVGGTYGNLTFSNFAKTLNSTVNYSVAGTFTPGSGTGHTITSTTFDFNGTGAQNIPVFNYNNLTISGNRSFNVVTLDPGTIGVAAALSITVSSVSYTTTGNTVDFNGATQTIPAFTYNNVNTSGSGTKTVGGALNVNGVLTIGTGTVLTAGANTISLRGAGACFVATGTFTMGTSTVSYDGSSSQTITAVNYYNLAITGTRPIATITLASGTIGIANNIDLSGLIQISGYSNVGNTVEFNGGAAQTSIPVITGFYNNVNVNNTIATTVLTFNSSGSLFNVGVSGQAGGSFTITRGIVNDNGRQIKSLGTTGVFTITANGTLRILNNSVTSPFPTNFVTYSLDPASTVEYNSTMAQDISNITSYGNLKVNVTGITTTKSLVGNTVLNGVLTVATLGKLDLGNYNLTINGATTPITNSGIIGGTSTGSATVILAGANVQNNVLNGGTFSPLFNLSITNTNASGVTLAGSGFPVQNFSIASGSLFNLGSQTLPIAGTYTNSGTLNGSGASGTLRFNGSSAQSLTIGTYTSSSLGRLDVANAAGLTLTAPLNVTGSTTPLILTNGLLNTTATNILTITSTAGIGGTPGSSSFVNGPMRRRIPANQSAAVTLLFPVGKSGYNSFELINPKTTSGGTVDIQAEVFDAAATVTPGIGFTVSPVPNRYWQTSVTSGSANLTTPGTVRLFDAGETITATTSIGYSATNPGTFNGLGGTNINTPSAGNITSQLTAPVAMGFFIIGNKDCLSGTYTVGSGGSYDFTKLYEAISALNAGIVCNDVYFELQSTYDGTTGEVFPMDINAVNYSGGPWNVTFRPAAGVSTRSTIGNPGSGVNFINLNGCSNIFFDGRAGGTGSTSAWILRNSQTATTYTPTFQFINDASDNVLRYLQIESQNQSTSSGTVVFSTAVTTGNDDNIIEYCDIRDGIAQPYNAIYASGTGLKANSGNIIRYNTIGNFYFNGGQSSGIRLESNNQGWTIDNNRFYQAARTPNVSGSEQYIIYLNSATLGGYTVSNNIIGGANAAGTGTYGFNGTNNARMVGIRIATTSGAQNQITGNAISNMSVTSTSGANTAYGIFSAIYTEGSAQANIDNNTIGGITGNDLITLSAGTAGAASFGINNSSSGDVIINNNKVGGVTTTGSAATVSHSFIAINSNSSAATVKITNNQIGSATTSRSIKANNATTVTAAGTAQTVSGITVTGNSGGNITVSNNLIRNMYVNATIAANTSTQIRGIDANSSVANISIDSNTICNLESEAYNSGTVLSAPIVGILNSVAAGGSPARNVRYNTIYALQSNNAASITATSIYGILLNMVTGTPVYNVNNNFIHSFNSGNTSASTEEIGIYVNYNATLTNNMIRLGRKADGTAVSQPHIITGIYDNIAGTSSYYFNTVLINGAAGSGTSNTYAFRRNASSGTKNVQNNIFANNRTGGGLNLAFATNTVTGYTAATFDNNIYHSQDNSLFSVAAIPAALSGATSALKMQNLRYTMPGSNLNSGVATLSQINFANATGDTSAVSLKLNSPSSASNAGISIAGITTDREGDLRSSTPDIGADEGSFAALTSAEDIYTPVFTFAGIPNQAICGGVVDLDVNVTIKDMGTGLNGAPALWWRRSAPTTTAWAFVNGTLQSGSSTNGLWNFAVSIPSPTLGDTYQYYVVAQDNASNIWYAPYDATSPVHSSPSVQVTPPTTPGQFTIPTNLPISGTVTVGPGGTYTTFGGTGGLFEAINTYGLNGDLTALVTGNITDINTNQLNQWTEYCGTGYHLYIQPQTTGTKVISVAAANGGGNGFIKIVGADRVKIDGSFGGSGNYLTFRNAYTATTNIAGTIYMNGTCQNDTLTNITIEGQGHNLTGGNLILNTGDGSSVAVTNCNIKGTTSSIVPNNLLYSAATGAGTYTVDNCNFFDFSNFGSSSSGQRATAILVDSTAPNSVTWSITNNSIYNSFIDGQGPQTAIKLAPGAASFNNVISDNFIGGSSPQCGTGGAVTYWGNSYLGDCTGMEVSTNTITISNNNITNIWISNGDYSGYYCLRMTGKTLPTVTGNVFGTGSNGQPSASKLIQVSGGGVLGGLNNGFIYGIYNTSTNTGMATYTGNDFYYLFQSGGCSSCKGGQVQCLAHMAAGPATITNNRINGPQSSGVTLNQFGIRVESAISSNGTLIEGNMVAGPYVLNSGAGNGVTNNGIYVRMTGSNTINGAIRRNTVWDMRSAEVEGMTEGIVVWSTTGGNGNWDISNNFITLKNNGNTGVPIGLFGIDLELNSASVTNVAYNTVYISGSNGGSPVHGYDFSSFAFIRYPGASGSTTGDALTLKNNVLVNTRVVSNAVTSGHFAIANLGTSGYGANWNASDHNLLVTGNGAKSYIGLWGTTSQLTHADWATASGKDATSGAQLSYTATYSSGVSNFATGALNPDSLFNNALSDLHIKITDNQSYKFVADRATPLSITTDYDGVTRNATTPDIGADEFIVCVAPAITANPSTTQSLCVNEVPANLTVTATGTPTLTYQWFSNTTNSNSGGTNLGSANGAQTDTYTPPASASGTKYYYVEVSGSCAPVAVSNTAEVVVNALPGLTPAATPAAICNGSNASLNANATAGSGTISSYAWSAGLGNVASGSVSPSTNTTYNVTVTNSNSCSASGSTSVTVNAIPSATPSASAATICNGGSTTLNANATAGSGSITNYSWSAGLGNVASGSVSPASSTTYTVTVTNSNTCTASASVAVTVNPCGVNTWLGNTSDWHTAINWSNGYVPVLCAHDVLIPDLAIDPVVSTTVNIGNIELRAGATLTLNANMGVCGNYTGGAVTPSQVLGSGILTLNGSGSQQLSGKSEFNTIRLNNSTGAVLQSGSSFDVFTAVELQSGTLNTTAGILRFRSTSSTAYAVLDNFSAGFSGTVNGNVTAERYYDAAGSGAKNQHLMGSPVNAAPLSAFGASGSAGYIIPTSDCDEINSAGNSPWGTVFSYDQTQGTTCAMAGWKVETSGSVTNAKGYSIYKVGSGTVTVTGAPNLNTSYTATNLGNNGWNNLTKQLRSVDAGWHLVANPYLADLDISGAVAGFDPLKMVWNTTGPFAGSYQPATVVAPFQAFMVRKSTSGGSVNYPINGTQRTRSGTPAFQKQANDHELSVTAKNNSTNLLDVTTVAFNADASASFDAGYDAIKSAGALSRHTLYTTMSGGPSWLCLNVVKDIETTNSIPLNFEPGVNGNYSFSFNGINTFDPTSYITLEDKLLNVFHDVRSGDYTFNADANDNWNRFVLHFTPAAKFNSNSATCNAMGNINITQPGVANWTYTIVNSANVTIGTGVLNSNNAVVASVPAGVYTVTLADNNGYTVVKNILVNGVTPVQAALSVSTTVAETGEDFTFTSTTANATTTTWNFGDGSATQAGNSVTHSFTAEGVYNVSLTVTNADGCSSTITQTVTVTAKNATGIDVVEVNGLRIWSNNAKVYVDFSKQSNVDAVIQIYNVLGQQLTNDHFRNGTLFMRTLALTEPSYIIISVKNNDQLTTRKLFIAGR